MKTISIFIGLCLLSFFGFECGDGDPGSMSISVVLGTGYASDSIRIDLNSTQIFSGKVTTNPQGVAWSKKYLSAWQESTNYFEFHFFGKQVIDKNIFLKKPSTVVFNYNRNSNTLDYQVLDGLIQ